VLAVLTLACTRTPNTSTAPEQHRAENAPTSFVMPRAAVLASATAIAEASDAGAGSLWGDSVGDAFGAAAVDRAEVGLASSGGDPGGRGDAGQRRSNSFGGIRQGATEVNGRLPPEVIQRIVRQNFGRFRLCYDVALKANPKLSGRLSVKFVITNAGMVQSVSNGGSDVPDPAMVACVLRGFNALSFPQPEGGNVFVTYPIIFTPPD
jgi:hypothetical protein